MDKGQQPLEKKMAKWRWTITIQIYLGLSIFVFFILMASFLGWHSLQKMNDIQKIITKQRIPEFSLAINIGQQSVTLTNTASQLLAASSEEEIEKVKELIGQNEKNLYLSLQQLEKTNQKNAQGGISDNFKKLTSDVIDNLNRLEASVMTELRLKKQSDTLVSEALSAVRKIDGLLAAAIDDRTFFLYTGWNTLGQKKPIPSALRFQENSLDNYRGLLSLKAQGQLASNLLNEVHRLSDADHIQPLRERFRAALDTCKRSLLLIDNQKFKEKIFSHIMALEGFGLGQEETPHRKAISGGLFQLLEKIFDEKQLQNQYLVRNQNVVQSLSLQTQQLIQDIRNAGGDTARIFEESVVEKRTQFLLLNVISVVLAIFLAWYFVGKYFIGRIKQLSHTMLTMAKGNLEVPLKLRGNDEITDMGQALEIFRNYAVEAQQLNLVKKLASEVQEKNTVLEDTIEKLKSAQERIVLQEKLASLGQLTSGIAHEIKNPLNFINNFSAISQELLDDISKELKEPENALPEKNRSFIEATLKDLHENLERINTHGQRANDIIKCMLQHSRGQTYGDKEVVDLNRFVNSTVNLAYQGKRTNSNDFNVDLQTNYGDGLEEVAIHAQDISRVILNLVTNACDAIEEKMGKLSEEQKKTYRPSIWISTEKAKINSQESIIIKIQDNGPGVPQALAQKIFNPFFTTKPTDKGTGLGLSLSHDIILKHGGKLALEHLEEGSMFIIELPLALEHEHEQRSKIRSKSTLSRTAALADCPKNDLNFGRRCCKIKIIWYLILLYDSPPHERLVISTLVKPAPPSTPIVLKGNAVWKSKLSVS